MGKHNRKTDWENLSPQQKADAFDRQFEHFEKSAEEKRERGEYPYDLDKKVNKK